MSSTTRRLMRANRCLASSFLVVIGLLVLGGGAALAYWIVTVVNDPGSYALAQASALSAPTSPKATVNGSGAITIGWTLPSSQLTGAQYQVTRTNGPGSPTVVCTVASNITSCQDSGLTAGTQYGYTVKAVLSNWQSSSIPISATTSTPTFQIALSTGPYTAGTPITVQSITAKIGGSTDTTYIGSKTINWSGLASSPSGQGPSYPASSLTFTNGVATPGTTFTAYAAGNDTISASDSAATGVTGSANFTLADAGAANFAVTPATFAPAAGTAFNVTVAAFDLYKNPAASYAGSRHLDLSGPHTAPDGTHTPTWTGTNVAETFSATGTVTVSTTLYDAETVGLTAKDHTAASITGTSSVVTVADAGAASFTVAPATFAPTAGTAFNVTVAAFDTYKNSAKGYAGTVHFTSSDAQAVLPANYTFTTGPGSDNGMHLFSVTLKTAGSQSVTATDTVTSTITGSQGGIVVSPATANKLVFSTTPSGNQTASSIASIGPYQVQEQDSFGNPVAASSTVTVNLSSSSTGTKFFSTTQNGGSGTSVTTVSISSTQTTSGNFFYSDTKAGAPTLTAQASGIPNNGTTSPTIVASSSNDTMSIVQGNSQSAHLSSAFSNAFEVNVVDQFGNPVPNVNVTFSAPSLGASGSFAATCASNPHTYQCVIATNGSGNATASTFTANGTHGSYNVSASSSGSNAVSFFVANTDSAVSLSLSPTSGATGTAVMLSGTGWAHSSTLSAAFNGTSVTLTNGTTASNGHISASCTFVVPSASTGTYLVVVTDGSGNVGAAQFTHS